VAFHPTLKQLHKEAVQLHRNIQSLLRKSRKSSPTPAPTLKAIAKEYEDPPIEAEREIRELVGRCLWDIFSDNHDVVARDARLVDIGSFRGSAGFIADQLNGQTGTRQYDYMDFYMGTVWISERTDLTPVYEMIFARLKARRFDWRYYLPRPEEASQAKKLDAELKKSRRKARQAPPPSTVQAYLNVYGCLPQGWPP
jgi:hypothetical protein